MTAREQVEAMFASVILSQPFDVAVTPDQMRELEAWAFELRKSDRPVDELAAHETVALQVFIEMHERAKFLNGVLSEATELIRGDGSAEAPPEPLC